MIRFFRVKGESMLPLLAEGDLVLAADWYWLVGAPRPGDRVVFRHPDYGTLVKLVDEVRADKGQLTVRGTRPVSLDSQEFGPIPFDALLGKVIWVVKK
jgi:nickel-type superoxide dismutase maturation protease